MMFGFKAKCVFVLCTTFNSLFLLSVGSELEDYQSEVPIGDLVFRNFTDFRPLGQFFKLDKRVQVKRIFDFAVGLMNQDLPESVQNLRLINIADSVSPRHLISSDLAPSDAIFESYAKWLIIGSIGTAVVIAFVFCFWVGGQRFLKIFMKKAPSDSISKRRKDFQDALFHANGRPYDYTDT